ncbi:MAG: polysaccharide biosynthesis C-terminal domain-containing protein [Kiritimatiellae bacterium]|nr:polysaccharide biosynthesis C-terminal domain-containing protein [Kiritimatiellia bacterium]
MKPAPFRIKLRTEKLATGKIGRLIVEYSWPALVAMSLNALYAVVDRFYIGRGCGEAAMAGLTLAFPVMMLFGAFGVFVGAGHAALLSIKLGEKDRVACEKLLGELVALKFLFFLVLPPLVFFNLDTVLGWCGGDKVSAEAFDCAVKYLRLVVFSHLFSHLAFGFSAMMRAEGGAVESMMCMVVGFGLNLVLDPILIFGFDMGIGGAAWATNAAMAASCFYALSYYLRGKSAVKFRLRRIGIYREYLVRASGIGFAPFLQHFLGSAINVSLAVAFAKWAADETEATMQIASLGVLQSMLILMLMPVLGAQQGLQPIIGYNWGARNYRRVRETVMTGLWMTTALVVAACIIQTVPPLPELMARMFVSSGNPTLLKTAASDLQICNCMLWCISLNIVATTYFQSIGKPVVAIVLSTLRQGFCILPVIWFLPYLMENRTLAILLSMPVSDIVCCLLTVVPFSLHMRFLSRVKQK